MPLSNDYFEQKLQSQNQTAVKEPAPSTPAPSIGGISQNEIDKNMRRAVLGAKMQAFQPNSNRSAISYLPKLTADMAVGYKIDQVDWNLMSLSEKNNLIQKSLYERINKTSYADYENANILGKMGKTYTNALNLSSRLAIGAGKFILGIPKEMIKAVPFLALSGLQLSDSINKKIYGGEYQSPPIPQRLNLPLLGDIRTAGLSYEEGLKIGMGKFGAFVKATGEAAGNAAMAYSAVDLAAGGYKLWTEPRWKKIASKRDFDVRPLVATEKYQIDRQIGKKSIQVKNKVEMSTPKQNPDITTIPLTNSQAAQFKGNANNTIAQIVPQGEGKALYNVYQLRKPLKTSSGDFFKKKFGRGSVIQTEKGPALKVYSQEINYDPQFFERQIREHEIGITSFRKKKMFNSLEETKAYYDSPEGEVFGSSLTKKASDYNIKNITVEQTGGVWEKKIEPSFLVKVQANDEDAFSYMAEHGAMGDQDAVIDFIAGDGEGAKIVFNNPKDIKTFIEDLNNNGINGATISNNGKDLIVYALDNSQKSAIIKVSKQHSYEKSETTAGEAKLITKPEYEKYGASPSARDSFLQEVAVRQSGGEIDLRFLCSEYTCESDYPQLLDLVHQTLTQYPQSTNNSDSFLHYFGKIIAKERIAIPNTFEEELKSFLKNKKFADEVLEVAARQSGKTAGKSIDPWSGPAPKTPSLMARPLKGFENELITGKQARQVIGLAKDRGIDNNTIQAISKIFNGKENLYNLTQNELYDVSEAIAKFPSVNAKPEIWDYKMHQQAAAFFSLARTKFANWEIDAANQGLTLPLDQEVRIPMEAAIRVSHAFRDSIIMNDIKDIMGRFSYGESGNKFSEERRIIGEYVKGNKKAITQNKLLDESTKKELIDIAGKVREFMKKVWESGDLKISHTRFSDNYLPELKVISDTFENYKTGSLPLEMKTFAEFERKGQLNKLEDDVEVLMEIYANAWAKAKYLRPAYDNAVKVINQAPENIRGQAIDWVEEIMGKADKAQKMMNEISQKLSEKTKGLIPKNGANQLMNWGLNLSYAGALGFPRVMPIVRNLIGQSVILPYAKFGPRFFKEGFWITDKDVQRLIDNNWRVTGGVIYGKESSQKLGQGPIGKTIDYYAAINRWMLSGYSWADLKNRVRTMKQTDINFKRAWNSFRAGNIDMQELENELDMASLSKTVQTAIRKYLREGTPESIKTAWDLLVTENLDQIQFGYRKGAGSEFHHGLRGKLFGQFSLYSWNYASLLKDWVLRGQWKKIIRLLGMGIAAEKSFEETSGIDISDWVGLGPIKRLPISPVTRIAMKSTEGIDSGLTGMDKIFNDNYQEILRSLKIFGGFATGVGEQRWERVFDAVKRYEQGGIPPDSTNPDEIFKLTAKSGKTISNLSFKDLLLYGFGFSSAKIAEEFEALNRIDRETKEKRMKENQAMIYLDNGDFEKFSKYYIENDLSFNPAKRLSSYQKSILQRVYERMNIRDKSKYYNLVMPLIYEQAPQ